MGKSVNEHVYHSLVVHVVSSQSSKSFKGCGIVTKPLIPLHLKLFNVCLHIHFFGDICECLIEGIGYSVSHIFINVVSQGPVNVIQGPSRAVLVSIHGPSPP